MEDAVVSVIVPVYKVEKYLAECITSIINQTYEDIYCKFRRTLKYGN